jgi:hypothetical protein
LAICPLQCGYLNHKYNLKILGKNTCNSSLYFIGNNILTAQGVTKNKKAVTDTTKKAKDSVANKAAAVPKFKPGKATKDHIH